MHLFNQESLAACFHALDGQKAMGANGITKAQYGSHLERNLEGLVERMKCMGYRPGTGTRSADPESGQAGCDAFAWDQQPGRSR